MKSYCASVGETATNPQYVINMDVVPAQLRHCFSGTEISTFALLGTCSQGSFVTKKRLKKIDLSGIRTSSILKH